MPHRDTDMCQPVKLRTDLADLGAEKLIVPDNLVLAERTARRRAWNAHREGAIAKQWHRGLIDTTQAVHLAGLDQLRGFHRFCRRHVVGGTLLVALAPFRRPPFGTDRRLRGLGARDCAAERGRQSGQAGKAAGSGKETPAIHFLQLFVRCIAHDRNLP